MQRWLQKMERWCSSSSLPLLIGLAAGLWMFTFGVIGFDFTYFPGDLGDARLNLYFLEHAHQFFTGVTSSFWDAPFMYPEQNVIAYSDNLLGSAPIYTLFRWVGLDTYAAYQWWFVVISALNYISAFYLLKRLFKHNCAAALGAFVFAFSVALQSQMAHAQTFPRYAIPLTLLMAIKFSEELQPRYFFYTLLFLVYQIYCGIYLGFMLAVPVAIHVSLAVLSAPLCVRKVVRTAKWRIAIATSAAASALLLLPLMLPYTARSIPPRLDHFRQIVHSIPTITSHFFSQQSSLLWGTMSKVGADYPAWWDHQLFAGAVATLCLTVGGYYCIASIAKAKFRLNHLPPPLLLLFAGGFTFLLFLRFRQTTAYLLLYFQPGFSAMRSLTRIINIELIFFAIATALVVVKITNRKPALSFPVFLIALTLLVVDNYFDPQQSHKTAVSEAKKRTAAVEGIFAAIPPGAVVSYEPQQMNAPSIHYQIDAMLTAQKCGLTTLNGYTATCPGDYGSYWNSPNASTRNYWLGGKELTEDTLYVIKSTTTVEKVVVKELQTTLLGKEEKELRDLVNYIKTDEEWMSHILEGRDNDSISIDSLVLLNAKWTLENAD